MFKFTSQNAHNWFKLISKYYPGFKVTVNLDQQDPKIGLAEPDFFQSLPTSKTYAVKVENAQSDLPTILTLPRCREQNDVIQHDNQTTEIIKNIDLMLRYRCGNLSSSVQLDVSNFEQIISAVSHLKTQKITRQCIFKDLEVVLIILDERDAVAVIMNCVIDSLLPVFDLTKGYSGYLGDELNVHFARWVEKFNSTNGDSWDDDIVTS